MLLGALVLLRKSLGDLDAIAPKLRELGVRHVAYGAQPEHYPVVGAALIASMAKVAGVRLRGGLGRGLRDRRGRDARGRGGSSARRRRLTLGQLLGDSLGLEQYALTRTNRLRAVEIHQLGG
jgi:globin